MGAYPVNLPVVTPAGVLSSRVLGTGPAVLFLHGGPGLSDYTDVFDAELAAVKRIRYTQRGLPPSTTEGPLTVGQHVRDAIAVLDAHGEREVILAGHSWGGFLAVAVAAAAPERVRGLLLLDTLGVVGDGGLTDFDAELMRRTPPRDAMLVEELSGTASDDSTEALALLWPAYFADPAHAPALPDDLRTSQRVNSETMDSVDAHLRTGDIAAAITGFDRPAEIVYGVDSPMPAAASLDTAALLAGSEVRPVPGAGHLLSVEQPGCIRAALNRLLSRLGEM
jgi:pimeloyl-ACP methyl ester carboxylesterase